MDTRQGQARQLRAVSDGVGLAVVDDETDKADHLPQLAPGTAQSPLLVTIAATVQLTGCSRSLIYQLITTGALRAVKVGRRTLIPHAELLRWVHSLPPAT